MKKTKIFLAFLLLLSLSLLMIPFSPFFATAESPKADCTVELAEHNVGQENYYITSDVTFKSDSEFTAGLFTVEAEGLILQDCSVVKSVGGDAPEIHTAYEQNKVLFTGFSESEVDDFRSYTELTLSLKFTAIGGNQTDVSKKVLIKDINIANINEVKFETPDAQGTLHIHSLGEEWITDETNHWHVCTTCQEKVDEAAHTFDTAVTPPTCTEEGYTTYTCTVCGYNYKGDIVATNGHNVGEWIFDETKHHRHCADCDQDVDTGEHAFEWIIVTPATIEADGLKKEVCSVCGYESGNTDVIPKLDQHIPGDINGDGSVNNKDLTRLFQYLSDWDVEVNEAALDVNGDGSVNNKDLTRLFQFLSDWDVEIF